MAEEAAQATTTTEVAATAAAAPVQPTAAQTLFPVQAAAEAAAAAQAAKTPEQIAAEAAATKTPEQIATEAAEAAKLAVPDKYEFKLPDGVTVDPAQVEAFTPIAKELKLTQEQAQKLVDFHAKSVAAGATAQAAAMSAQIADWGKQSAADKDFGGAKFAENTAIAVKALDKFGTPALRQALNDSGMGNHPEVVRFFWKVGQTVTEGAFNSGNQGGGGAPKTAAQILFPTLK